MDLLIPETGTLVWMLLAFGIVFFILVKWGFPLITGMVDKSNDYIDKSLAAAQKSNERLAGIEKECNDLLKETRAEKARILKEASDRREEIVTDAMQQAREEGERIIAEAREQIRQEKEEALRGLRRQVADLSCQVAERILRDRLSKETEQLDMIDRMIDDAERKA